MKTEMELLIGDPHIHKEKERGKERKYKREILSYTFQDSLQDPI